MKGKNIKLFLILLFFTFIISGCGKKQEDLEDISGEDKLVYEYLEENNSIIDVDDLSSFKDL